jgi:hypothetical protein
LAITITLSPIATRESQVERGIGWLEEASMDLRLSRQAAP